MPEKSRSVTGNHDTAGQVALSRSLFAGYFPQVILQNSCTAYPFHFVRYNGRLKLFLLISFNASWPPFSTLLPLGRASADSGSARYREKEDGQRLAAIAHFAMALIRREARRSVRISLDHSLILDYT
jgi:hypothetical protein